jgi:hypothetical protein
MKKHTRPTSDRKVSYKITNRKEYDKALQKRGDISNLINPKIIATWKAEENSAEKSVGRVLQFSPKCIETLLLVKECYHLSYRALIGFVKSMLKLCGIDFKLPSISQICKRSKSLEISLNNSDKKTTKVKSVAVDSTGLKFYGVGEWFFRIHGKKNKKLYRRRWRKMHLLVDVNTFEVIGFLLTTESVGDSQGMLHLLRDIKVAEEVYGDGAYSWEGCFEKMVAIGAVPRIALNKILKLKKSIKGLSKGAKAQQKLIREMANAGGKEEWRKTSGYGKRSLIETTMFRFKTLFGGRLSSKLFFTQITEVAARLRLLNMFTNFGMPITVRSSP